MPPTDAPPPPGSHAALKQGCTCPVQDNAHGRGYLGIKGIYVWVQACPLHTTNPSSTALLLDDAPKEGDDAE